MKLTIEQLANSVNQELDKQKSNYETTDKRIKEKVSIRRIQDYITKGLLDKPIREGNKTYYSDIHFEKLLALRRLGNSGLSDNSLLNISIISESFQDDELKNNALSQIKDIRSLVDGGNTQTVGSVPSYLDTNSFLASSTLARPAKVWQEFPVDNEGKCFLKLEVGSKIKNPEEILVKIKQILNIGDK